MTGARSPPFGDEDDAAVHQLSSGGAGRLDGCVDDDAEQLVDVVSRGQGLSEAKRRLPEAAPLLLELVHARLELVGHLVEGMGEGRKLVAAPHVDAVAEPAARDSPRCVGEAAERADDRAALDVRDGGDHEQRREHGEEEPRAQPAGGLVDPRLRRQDDERCLARLGEPVRGERAEPPSGDTDLRRLGRRANRPPHRDRGGDDATALDERELPTVRQSGTRAQVLGEAAC